MMALRTPELEKEKDLGASGDVLPAKDVESSNAYDDEEDGEVFKKNVDGMEYRTVGWIKTFFLMFKVQFSLGILSIPAVFGPVGAVPGSLLIIGWGSFNTYSAFVQASFRNRHPGMHGIQDMAYLVGGKWYKEFVGAMYMIGFTLVTGSGYVAGAVAFNALSNHGACTVWFAFISFVICTVVASFPKFGQIGIASWIGGISLYTAVLILTIAVAVRDRPAAAPEGVTDYGFTAIGSPTFLSGLAASTVIFISSSGHSANIPMIAEMRNPKEYKKPIAACMGLLNVSYLVFSLVIFRYCGRYIASPSLGSAGPMIKKICYGIGLPGILASTIINQHLAAKYFFVRILRDTPHLQARTKTHWVTWFGATIGVGIGGFIIAEAIPFFGTLLSFVSAISFTPLAIIIPMTLWLWDFADYRKGSIKKKLIWSFHVLMILIGLFQVVAGAYAAIQDIIDQYAAGTVSSAFSCADNSNSS
jgi:hypothetical protein